MKDDFWAGIESGFPLCCIQFYVDFYNVVRENKFMFNNRESHDYSTGIGYVQCPNCIIKNIRRNK